MTDWGLAISPIIFIVAQAFSSRDAFRGRTTVTLLASVPTAVGLANIVFWLAWEGLVVSASLTAVSSLSWWFLAYMRINGGHVPADAVDVRR